jgi:Protein of unknown function (DUF2812)
MFNWFYGSIAKTIKKKFDSFTEEKHWLQSMLDEGLVLKGYEPETMGPCQYYFDPIQYEDQKNRTYKIDYRLFRKDNDFHEYKGIFEDTRWTMLSTDKIYAKHIFHTNGPHANCAIFSDLESYKEREKRKMASARNLVIASLSFLLFSILVNVIFDMDLMVAGPMGILLGIGLPSTVCRRVL